MLGLMKSAAMELGQYGITVNALIPGLVDTPLTQYPKRLSEAIGESRQNPPRDPSAEEAWDVRAPTVPLRSVGSSPRTSLRPQSFSLRMQRLW